MKIRRIVATSLATAALVLGGAVVAAPSAVASASSGSVTAPADPPPGGLGGLINVQDLDLDTGILGVGEANVAVVAFVAAVLSTLGAV